MDKESLQRMFASSYASFRKDLSRSLTGQGVSGRREYWNFCAWALAAGVILPAAAWQAFSVESVFPGVLIAVSFAIGWAAGTGILTVSFANLSVRRLHDAGLSAWLMLLYLIPGVFPLLAILAGIPETCPPPANRYTGFRPEQFGGSAATDAGRATAAAAAVWYLVHLAVIAAAGAVLGIISLLSTGQDSELPGAAPDAPQQEHDLVCRDDPENCRNRS